MQNTYIPKFTYVIPFRYSPDRIIPLRRIIDWLSGFQGIEIMVVEQDKHSKISHLNLRVNHVFIESDAPFNKSWSYNVALKRASSPILIFGDGDFMMNPNDLIDSLRILDSCDCVIPTNNIVTLSPQESVADMNMILGIKRPGFKSNMTNGIVLFKKDSLVKIGGWNEDFVGLGYENKFQDMKIMKMLNYKQLEFTGYHLFHQNVNMDINLDQRNRQIFDFYQDGDINKLQQHINMTIPKIGTVNKYQ
jgi:hypothetical protein